MTPAAIAKVRASTRTNIDSSLGEPTIAPSALRRNGRELPSQRSVEADLPLHSFEEQVHIALQGEVGRVGVSPDAVEVAADDTAAGADDTLELGECRASFPNPLQQELGPKDVKAPASER